MPIWSILPFFTLLFLIAMGPVILKGYWHDHFHYISLSLGSFVCIYYIYVTKDLAIPISAASDYFSFITMTAALYIIAGCIHFDVDYPARPFTNVLFLAFGALISNIIGATGASILLIRPF